MIDMLWPRHRPCGIGALSPGQAFFNVLRQASHAHAERAVRLLLRSHMPAVYSRNFTNHRAGFGWNFGSMDYNDDWRVCRKMTHQEFHATPFKKYRPVLTKHAHDFVRRLAGERGARLPAHLKQ